MELEPLHPVELKFPAVSAGQYTVTVLNSARAPIATQTVDVQDSNLEFQNTARDMEALRQWASVSGGLALKAEECENGGRLVAQINARLEQARQGGPGRRPIGVNGGMLGVVLACFAGEWLLRRRWDLN